MLFNWSCAGQEKLCCQAGSSSNLPQSTVSSRQDIEYDIIRNIIPDFICYVLWYQKIMKWWHNISGNIIADFIWYCYYYECACDIVCLLRLYYDDVMTLQCHKWKSLCHDIIEHLINTLLSTRLYVDDCDWDYQPHSLLRWKRPRWATHACAFNLDFLIQLWWLRIVSGGNCIITGNPFLSSYCNSLLHSRPATQFSIRLLTYHTPSPSRQCNALALEICVSCAKHHQQPSPRRHAIQNGLIWCEHHCKRCDFGTP